MGSQHFLLSQRCKDPTTPEGMRIAGLPYGAKPRLFRATSVLSPSKTSPLSSGRAFHDSMMIELGLGVTGGNWGTIQGFKDSDSRLAACKFTIIGPGPRGRPPHQREPLRF